MPKNKGLGGKKKKRGKGIGPEKKALVLKDEGQEYAQIEKLTGSGFVDVICFSSGGNISRRAHIRGKMRKRVWLAKGDIVLVNVRDYQDNTCDVVAKYNENDIKRLMENKALPTSFRDDVVQDDNIEFEDPSKDDVNLDWCKDPDDMFDGISDSDSDSDSESESEEDFDW